MSASLYASVLKNADAMLTAPVVTYAKPDGARLLDVSRTVLDRSYTLMLAWKVSGNSKYGARLWSDLDAASNFPDWNPDHFLDTAEMTHAFAIAYDWGYPYWDSTKQAQLRKAILDKGLAPSLKVYDATSVNDTPYKYRGNWAMRVDNVNIVINSAMAMGALAVANDTSSDLPQRILDESFASLQIGLGAYGPDGGFKEGPSYWDYATRYVTSFLGSVKTATGSDYGLASSPGLSQTASFMEAMTAREGSTTGSLTASPSFSPPRLTPVSGPCSTTRPRWRWPRLDQVVYLRTAPAYPPRPRARVRGKARRNDAAAEHLRGGRRHLDERVSQRQPGVLRRLPLRERARRQPPAPGRAATSTSKPSDRNGPWTWAWRPAPTTCWPRTAPASVGTTTGPAPKATTPWRWTPSIPLRASGRSDAVDQPRLRHRQRLRGRRPVRGLPQDATSWRRGVRLFDNRSQLMVQDEINASGSFEALWSMHTGANVQVAADGRSAVLFQNGERVLARIVSPGSLTFVRMAAAPLPTSPALTQTSNDGISKLAIAVKGSDSVSVAVQLTPLRHGTPIEVAPAPVCPDCAQLLERRRGHRAPLGHHRRRRGCIGLPRRPVVIHRPASPLAARSRSWRRRRPRVRDGAAGRRGARPRPDHGVWRGRRPDHLRGRIGARPAQDHRCVRPHRQLRLGHSDLRRQPDDLLGRGRGDRHRAVGPRHTRRC